MTHHLLLSFFFFFNDTATTEIYTLSLHDALPISSAMRISGPTYEEYRPAVVHTSRAFTTFAVERSFAIRRHLPPQLAERSEEHTSELQSRPHLVCRLLLEKKKKKTV